MSIQLRKRIYLLTISVLLKSLIIQDVQINFILPARKIKESWENSYPHAVNYQLDKLVAFNLCSKLVIIEFASLKKQPFKLF